MKCIFYLSILLSLISCVGESEPKEETSEENSVVSNTICFDGELDDQYNISMKLNLPDAENGDITGTYFYHSQGKEIELKGTKEGDNISLDEFVDGEITGHFEGLMEVGSLIVIDGDWSSSDENSMMSFNLIENVDNVYEEYLTAENERNSGNDYPDALSFEELTEKFRELDPPFGMDFEKELQDELIIDSSTVMKYMTIDQADSYNEYGFNTHWARYKYEKDEYVALVVWHEYTPGVGGVYDLYVEIFTFDKDGNRVDGERLGCECSDQEPASNTIYYTNPDFEFRDDGTIIVVTEHVTATLHEEELDDPTDAVYEVETTTAIYTIEPDGKIFYENPG